MSFDANGADVRTASGGDQNPEPSFSEASWPLLTPFLTTPSVAVLGPSIDLTPDGPGHGR